MGTGKLANHLAAFHKHAAAHHDTLHACYSKIAGFGKAAKSQMKDGDGESLADCLQKIADTHEAAAEFHRGMMEDCSKVTGDELGKSANTSDLVKRVTALENTVIPTRVSAVVPNAPGITAVPRAGARPMPSEKPNVPVAFEKLITIEE